MSRRIALSLAAGVSAVVLLLAGCGGDQTGASPSAPLSASTPSPASTQSSTSPSPTGPTTTPGAASTPSEQPGGDAAKPSKQDIVAGLSKFYRQTQGLPADKAEKFAVCMVDEMYDKAQTTTLEAMRDGDTTKIATRDAGLVAEAGFTCQPALS